MPKIISDVLYDRIRTSDATLTELVFAKGGTDFFGVQTQVRCDKGEPLTSGSGGSHLYPISYRYSGKRDFFTIAKTLSNAFFYDPHSFEKWTKVGDRVLHPDGVHYSTFNSSGYRWSHTMHSGEYYIMPPKTGIRWSYGYPGPSSSKGYVCTGHTANERADLSNAYLKHQKDFEVCLHDINVVCLKTQLELVNERYQFDADVLDGVCGFEELGRAIATNTTLRKIDLTSSEPTTMLVDQRDSIALLNGIAHATGIQELILAETELGDEGLRILCNMLSENRLSLKQLVINARDVIANPERLAKLQTALRENRSLEVLVIKALPEALASAEISALVASIEEQVRAQLEARKVESIRGEMASGALQTPAAISSRAPVTLRSEWDAVFFEREIMTALDAEDTKAAEAMLDLAIEGKCLSQTEQARLVMEISQRYLQTWSAKMMAMTRGSHVDSGKKSFYLNVMRRQIELWTEKYSDAASAPAPVVVAPPPVPPTITPLRDATQIAEGGTSRVTEQEIDQASAPGGGGSNRH